jgi:CBS domain-containing protein
MYQAKDIMSKRLASVKKDASIKDVIRLLVEHRITGLPVVDDHMYLVGMVTEKDVLKMLYESRSRGRATVQDLMTTEVVTFDEDDDLIDVFKCLVENNFRRLPILSEGKLTGIISRRDVINFLYERGTGSKNGDDGSTSIREPGS